MSFALADKKALVIGVGGLGCPVALLLCQAGIGEVILADDDEVDESNLGRQILFGVEHVGKSKVEAARSALLERGAKPGQIRTLATRCLPDNARALVRSADIVLEGADNYATKFLVADAARLEARAVIHGAAVGWRATVLAASPAGAPCYRCLFEDLPQGPGAAQNCDTVGVIGPVVGLAGALMADAALAALEERPVFGHVLSYDGKRDRLRKIQVERRDSCPLCGPVPGISDIDEARYLAAGCAS